MSKYTISAHEINKHLDAQVKNAKVLNYCRLLLPEKEGILSVIGKYDPCCYPHPENRAYCVLDEALQPCLAWDPETYYYGMSPAVDEQIIVEAIADGRFRNEARLEDFLRAHHHSFMLHSDQSRYLLPCAKLFVLSVAHNFGIRLRTQDPALRQALLNFQESTLTEKGRTEDEVLLCGCPTEELFALLEHCRFTPGDSTDFWNCGTQGLTLEQVYRQPGSILLLKGHTFYSGALLKVLKIEEHRENYGNDQVVPLCVSFERSSYATVFSFDNNFTGHPLLADCRSLLTRLYREDDRYKRALRDATTPKGEKDVISQSACLEALNTYLARSHNVNQLGVTGNVLTSDNILLVGLRDQSSIDSGALYPSVNGNAEVVDNNVRFYKMSAYEDYPAIRIDDPRIDFNGELNREGYAELGVHLGNNWHCYGITVSGFVPPEEEKADGPYPFEKRRLHLNVLCEQSCTDTFAQVHQAQKNATEAFESRTMNGIQVSYHKNIFAFLGSSILEAISNLLSNESYIMAFAALGVLLSNIFSSQDPLAVMSVSDALSSFFTVLTIFAFVVMVVNRSKEYWKKRKHLHPMRLIGSKRIYAKLDKYLEKYASHPVTRAAIMCHIAKTVHKGK